MKNKIKYQARGGLLIIEEKFDCSEFFTGKSAVINQLIRECELPVKFSPPRSKTEYTITREAINEKSLKYSQEPETWITCTYYKVPQRRKTSTQEPTTRELGENDELGNDGSSH